MIKMSLSSNVPVLMPLKEVCLVVGFLHMQINCNAGAVGLPVWTGNDSWSAAAQVICTAHSKQAAPFVILQIHMKSRHGFCVNYSSGNDSLFLVSILLNYLTSCHDPVYFPLCLLNLFELYPVAPCMTATQKLRNLGVLGRHHGLLEQVVAKTSHLVKSLLPGCLWKGL